MNTSLKSFKRMIKIVKVVVMMNVKLIIKEELVMTQRRMNHQRNKIKEVKREVPPPVQVNKNANNNDYLSITLF